MERRIIIKIMTEEQVTKSILMWLEDNGWFIISYDFPQSGTGISIHSNNKIRKSKNDKVIIPDILAHKENKLVYFENKDRFVLSDFIKLNEVKSSGNYSESFNSLLENYDCQKMFFGVGLPNTRVSRLKSKSNINYIDFIIMTDGSNFCDVIYQSIDIFG